VLCVLAEIGVRVIYLLTDPKKIWAILVLFATVAGVSSATVNAICVWYTLSRLAYGAAYILIESEELSIVRSMVWWSCNASCITGLVLAARAL